MKTQSINLNYPSSVAFGSFRRDSSTMSKKMFELVTNAPAVKHFGDKYDAQIGIGRFLSTKDILRQQIALVFEDVKPKSLIGRLKNFISAKAPVSMKLKTRATNEEDFISEISNLHSDTLFKIYKK